MRLQLMVFVIFDMLIFSGVALAERSGDYAHSEGEMQGAFENCDIHARKKLCQSVCRSALNEINRAKTQGGVPNAATLKQCREYSVAGNRKIAPNSNGYDYEGLRQEMKTLNQACNARADARKCGTICTYAIRGLNSAETKGLDPNQKNTFRTIQRCRNFFSNEPVKSVQKPSVPAQVEPKAVSVSAEGMGEKAKHCKSELAALVSNANPENFEHISKLQQCYGYCAGAAQYIAAGLKNLEKSIKLCADTYSQAFP